MQKLRSDGYERVGSTCVLRISVQDLYLSLICIFPIVTTLFNISLLNRILFAALVFLHVCSYIERPMKRTTFILLLFFLCHYIYVFAITDPPYENLNLLFYFPYFLMYSYFVCDHYERIVDWISKRYAYISFVLLLWTVLVGISVFLPSCYVIKKDGIFFVSYCDSIFRLGPCAIFVQILGILCQVFYRKKYAVIYQVIPLYCFLAGASRTYLLIGLCIFFISWYIFCGKKKLFWITIVPVGVILGSIFITSAIMDRIEYLLDENHYGDFWFRFTSGRSDFWVELLDAWINSPIYKKLFGNGFDFSNDTIGIWAHNDFLEILVSFGILGFILYCHAIGRLFHSILHDVKLPRLFMCCSFMIWFFNATFNMHFTYFCAMLSFPFLLLALRRAFSEAETILRELK